MTKQNFQCLKKKIKSKKINLFLYKVSKLLLPFLTNEKAKIISSTLNNASGGSGGGGGGGGDGGGPNSP